MIQNIQAVVRNITIPTLWAVALSEEIADQKDRILLWIPVIFAFGITGYFALPFEPPVALSGALWLVLASLWFFLAPLRYAGRRAFIVWLVVGGIFFMASGFGVAQMRTVLLKAPILQKEMSFAEITGIIADIDLLAPGAGSRIILDHLVIEKLAAQDTPRRVRIKVHDDKNLQVGVRVRVLAGLNPPSAPIAPGTFDFQRYAYFKQIGAFGFAYRAPEFIDMPEKAGFWARVDQLRHVMIARVERHVDYPQAAFVAALMAGERAAIAQEDWQAIRAAGLAHMLAISGLHVGIVAGILFFVSRFFMATVPYLALHHPIKKYAALFAFLGAAGYTILAGAGVPTLRALFMTGIVLLAVMLDRAPFSIRTVALAALVVLFFSPESLFSASFQMSFAAVTALVFAYDLVRPWWSRLYRGSGRGRRAMMYFAGVILTTLVAGSAVAPFSLYHFQQYPMYDIPANILAAPLMSFLIMPGVVLTFFAMPLGLEGLALIPLEWGISGLLYIARDVESLPNATWNPPGWPPLALTYLALGALWLMLWQGRLRSMGIILIVCGLFVITTYKQPDILISSSGKLVALRTDDTKMHLSSKVFDRFSAENWARLYGVKEENIVKFPREGRGRGDVSPLQCGEWGCRTVLQGQRIALSTHEQSHATDCAWAHIVIARDPVRVRGCQARAVLDVFDFWRSGAHALWLNDEIGDKLRIETVASTRGERPWIVSHRR